MRVDVMALRQQAWRAEKVYDEFIAYSESIGCTRFQDEIICDTDEKAKLIARWWKDHT